MRDGASMDLNYNTAICTTTSATFSLHVSTQAEGWVRAD